MDPRFHAAQQAIRDDQPERLEALLRAQPELRHIASEDPRDHPNLLNCLVLELPPRRDLRALMALFREGGADLGSALVAAASVDNRPAVRALLDWGTPLNPSTGWSALDEALYWVHTGLVAELRERGAAVRSLRGWAAVGDVYARDGHDWTRRSGPPPGTGLRTSLMGCRPSARRVSNQCARLRSISSECLGNQRASSAA